MQDENELPPPQPLDRPGTRPEFSLAVVVGQVVAIQTKLAGERAMKKSKEKV